MKLLIIDTETCGLKPWLHCPDQVSGMVVFVKSAQEEGEKDTCVIKQKFDIQFRVQDSVEVDEKAYTFRGMSSRQMRERPMSSQEAFSDFTMMLDRYVNKFDKNDKFIPIGYNLGFDLDMLQRWFILHGDKYFGSYVYRPGIDVLSLALDRLFKHRHKMPDFKQGSVARALGIEVDNDKLHDSAYDIEILWQIYLKVKGVPVEKIHS